ncbi:aldehyde dehydrogenase family protein [Phytoactinopolyspora limicola]|uniref:aldehyde dehydrogenase family protein n=1 Tax=Phytoactinopolyspora limicola TaxID=2715536 RepID=UPI00140CE599|nr:aldehyde dehydrogenase family protein [Phytoactinopolyspora limicola]
MSDTAVHNTLVSINPRTGESNGATSVTPSEGVDDAVARAAEVAESVGDLQPRVRADWLRAIAHAVDTEPGLVELADRETAKGTDRLTAELTRATDQLRFYADVAAEGSWLGAVVETTQVGGSLARMRQPLGPVAVFGASNFPFAYGVLGNDTGSALAAGCPVVAKAHPAHPLLSERLGRLAREALQRSGAPDGVFAVVAGFDTGPRLVTAPDIAAVGFTGSQAGGLALWRLAAERPVAIPVFAEMGTVNPVVVTPAAGARFTDVADGLAGAFTLGMGQYCTKPGLVLAPRGYDVAVLAGQALLAKAPAGWLLTPAIAEAYHSGLRDLGEAGAVTVATVPGPGGGASVPAAVLSVDADRLRRGSRLLEECFGPVLLVAEYNDDAHLEAIIGELQGALAASVITSGADDPDVSGLVRRLSRIVGRVVVDGWTPGVSLAWGQQHGGPWPSTTAPSTTSVGAAALDRFTRPVAYEGAPDGALPPALRAANPWRIPRRVVAPAAQR